jgi:hypothetical protein
MEWGVNGGVVWCQHPPSPPRRSAVSVRCLFAQEAPVEPPLPPKPRKGSLTSPLG